MTSTAQPQITEAQWPIFRVVAQNPGISASGIRRETGFTRSALGNHLARLRNAGVLDKKNKGRAVLWRVALTFEDIYYLLLEMRAEKDGQEGKLPASPKSEIMDSDVAARRKIILDFVASNPGCKVRDIPCAEKHNRQNDLAKMSVAGSIRMVSEHDGSRFPKVYLGNQDDVTELRERIAEAGVV